MLERAKLRILPSQASDEVTSFAEDFLRGLGHMPKRVEPKYFYDTRGSELFEKICELDAYYPTRSELAIMRESAAEMAFLAGRKCRLIDIGSGNSQKSRLLIEHLVDIESYVPVDISEVFL